MRAAFDMDKLRLLHVHRVQDILHGLVQLEAGNVKAVLFDNTERHGFLGGLTTFQLAALFKNVTGEDKPAMTDLDRRAALAVAIDTLRPPLVDDIELDKQIAVVAKLLEGKIGAVPHFRYVLGGREPKVGEALAGRTIQRDDKMRLAASAALQRGPAPAAAVIPAAPLAGTLREKTGVPGGIAAQPSGAPRGNVAVLVWEVADRMWQAAGSPKDTKVVLALRIEMMKVLEEENDVKKLTSSNTLGQWMKARLSKET